MRYEDEGFIRSAIDEDMRRFGSPFSTLSSHFEIRRPSGIGDESGYLVEQQAQAISDLRSRLTAANTTIRSANRRIEELKAVKTEPLSNPDFAVLGLDPNTAFKGFSEEEIQMVLQSAYRIRSKINHPDNGGSTVTMRAVNLAYGKLKDPKTRGNYLR